MHIKFGGFDSVFFIFSILLDHEYFVGRLIFCGLYIVLSHNWVLNTSVSIFIRKQRNHLVLCIVSRLMHLCLYIV
jgi:hypothetical protein